MRVAILAVGHKMPSWIEEGFREYTRRMPPEIRVELIEVKPGRDKDAEGGDDQDRGSGDGGVEVAALELAVYDEREGAMRACPRS